MRKFSSASRQSCPSPELPGDHRCGSHPSKSLGQMDESLVDANSSRIWDVTEERALSLGKRKSVRQKEAEGQAQKLDCTVRSVVMNPPSGPRKVANVVSSLLPSHSSTSTIHTSSVGGRREIVDEISSIGPSGIVGCVLLPFFGFLIAALLHSNP